MPCPYDHRFKRRPILSFARANLLGLLREVVGALAIPEAVYDEIVVHGTGLPGADEVRDRAWIIRASITDRQIVAQLPHTLHAGEREAIAPAREQSAALLMDDQAARRVAEQYGVPCLGSLRLLEEAKQRGMIVAVKPTLDVLMAAGLYLSDSLYHAFLRRIGEENLLTE